MASTFHYTDKDGWNGVRSQPVWRFVASQPKDPSRPFGAYFTDIEPSEQNLKTLFKRIRVPKAKQAYVFWFLGRDGLRQWNDGRGRDKRIYYSERLPRRRGKAEALRQDRGVAGGIPMIGGVDIQLPTMAGASSTEVAVR